MTRAEIPKINQASLPAFSHERFVAQANQDANRDSAAPSEAELYLADLVVNYPAAVLGEVPGKITLAQWMVENATIRGKHRRS